MAEQLHQGKESVIGQPANVEYIPGQRIREEAHGQLNFEGMERPVEDSGSLMQDPETIDPLTYEDEIPRVIHRVAYRDHWCSTIRPWDRMAGIYTFGRVRVR